MVVLAATPIGDAADASPRLRAELTGADVIAAEDTRRLRRLLDRLDVVARGRIVSYFEGNEAARTPELLAALAEGARVVVVSDAGMPSVSDPGYRLVAAAIEQGVRVTAVPGPSAVLTALAVSGLPVDRFCFEGFLPRKAGERTRRLTDLAAEPRTHGLLRGPAPHRRHPRGDGRGVRVRPPGRGLPGADQDLRGDRPRTRSASWSTGPRHQVRGEVTLVVGGQPLVLTDLAGAVGQVLALTGQGAKLKPAVAEVAGRTGLAKNLLYDHALQAGRDRGGE